MGDIAKGAINTVKGVVTLDGETAGKGVSTLTSGVVHTATLGVMREDSPKKEEKRSDKYQKEKPIKPQQAVLENAQKENLYVQEPKIQTLSQYHGYQQSSKTHPNKFSDMPTPSAPCGDTKQEDSVESAEQEIEKSRKRIELLQLKLKLQEQEKALQAQLDQQEGRPNAGFRNG